MQPSNFTNPIIHPSPQHHGQRQLCSLRTFWLIKVWRWNFSRETGSCWATWHVSTSVVVFHQETCCDWALRLSSLLPASLTFSRDEQISVRIAAGFLPCDQVCSPLSGWVSEWLCSPFKKPHSCIIYQPGERCCSRLVSHSSCVPILSANSCLFRQVWCKCGCSDLHI